MAAPKESQLQKAEELQDLLLANFEYLLKNDLMTPTDRATLTRLLTQNGWTIDPSMLPQGLRDKLTTKVDPLDFEEDE